MNDRSAAMAINQHHRRPYGALAVLALLQLPIGSHLFPGTGASAQLFREALFWLFVAAIIVYVRQVERRPLESIGLKPVTWRGVAIGILGALTSIALMAFCYFVVLPALKATDESQMSAIQNLPFGLRLAMITRAAVFEELFYRGFAIERLSEITGNRWLAALVSLAAFIVAHLDYWGLAHLLIVAVGGSVLTALYLWRRDLVATMCAHFTTDAVGLLMA